MKNKLLNIFIFTVLATIFLSSCKTMKMTDLKPEPKNEKLLPTIEARVDMSSLESAYSLGASTSRSETSGVGTSTTSTTISKDVRIQDVVTIFDRDVKDNITNPFGDSKGFILCKINASNQKVKKGWTYLSMITLFIPNLVGMPMASYEIALDVTVEIYNNSEKLIARYNGTVKNKEFVAAYWGYNSKDIIRVANIMAFRDAMNQIKMQIDSDYKNILEKLDK